MEPRSRWQGPPQLTLLVILGGLLSLYIVPGTAELRLAAAEWGSMLLFPAIIWVLLARRRNVRHAEEARFWGLLAVFFGCWLVAEIVLSTISADSLAVWLGSDCLFLASYLAFALAIQSKPHLESGWSSRNLHARFMAGATALFFLGLLTYFALIPGVLDPESYATFVPSFYLFLSLDALLTGWLAHSWLTCNSRSWRRIYGALTLAMGIWCVGDTLDYLIFSGAADIPLGTPVDILYFVPIFVVLTATTFRVKQLSSAAGLEEAGLERDEVPSPLPLVFAFLLPLLHLSVDNLEFLGEPSRDAREVTVTVTLLGLIGLMFAQQRALNRKNQALRSRVDVLVTNEEVLQSQKLEALGRLAGGIAHEFNNALLVIRGYTDLSLRRLPSEDPMRDDLESIVESADHVASLTKELLAFGRRQRLSTELVDLSSEVERCRDMLQRIIGEDVELVCALGEDLGSVRVDRGQIGQVIVNLAINARAAMPAGGILTIETSTRTLDGSLPGDLMLPEGEYVVLMVRDTGLGMDEETRQRIFEPFFTTKEEGVGLGLATVHGIVSQSGGFVKVKSESGMGTTFFLYFPIASEQAMDVVEKELVPPARIPGRGPVLLVEDERNVRRLTARFLRERGFEVVEAENGESALRIAEGRDDFRLLLTDVVMPGMGGRALYERIAKPKLPVIFMSGYAAQEALPDEDDSGEWTFLEKPFSMGELERVVHEVLDENVRRDSSPV